MIKDFNQIVFILEAYSKLRKISLNKKKNIYFFWHWNCQLGCYHLKKIIELNSSEVHIYSYEYMACYIT